MHMWSYFQGRAGLAQTMWGLGVNKHKLSKCRVSCLGLEVRLPEFRTNQGHAVLSGQYRKGLMPFPERLVSFYLVGIGIFCTFCTYLSLSILVLFRVMSFEPLYSLFTSCRKLSVDSPLKAPSLCLVYQSRYHAPAVWWSCHALIFFMCVSWYLCLCLQLFFTLKILSRISYVSVCVFIRIED